LNGGLCVYECVCVCAHEAKIYAHRQAATRTQTHAGPKE